MVTTMDYRTVQMPVDDCVVLRDPPAVSGLLLLMAAVALAKALRPCAFDCWNTVSDGSLQGICDGHWWNVITPAFVHSDIRHFLYNAFFLCAYGCLLERVVGSLSVVALFLCGHVAGFLFKLLINRVRHPESYVFVGGMGCSRCASRTALASTSPLSADSCFTAPPTFSRFTCLPRALTVLSLRSAMRLRVCS